MRPGTILIFLFSIVLCFGQQAERKGLISSTELRQDAAALRKALEKYHPGLYWYTTEQEFNSAWDSLDQKLDQPLTELDFFRLLLPVVAKVKCAHTLFNPSATIIASGSRFPISIKVIGEKAYLTPEANDANIPSGSELISINNKSTAIILQQLMRDLQAQGGNRGWKKVILENDFQNYYYYTIEQPDQFLIKYINYRTGQEESKVMEGSTSELLRKHWKNWYPATDGPPLNIQYAENSELAILTIKSFVRGRAKTYRQDFDKLIDQYFAEIKTKGIKKLIIDVRGNEGGNNPEKLYAYVAKESQKASRAKNNFEGSVIVLANERSISAQETFVSMFKYYKRGLVVGRNTPGCFKGHCGGKKHTLTLPNSKFEILIPMYLSKGIHDEQTMSKPGNGFSPDFYVEENIRDIVQGKDAIKTLALDLMQKTP